MLENGYCLKKDDTEYRILEMIGKGANTVAYLAEKNCNGLLSKCILKEYAPHNTEPTENGRARFIAAGKMQNTIRQHSILNNQTPPLSCIFEANGTAYSETVCYGGNILSRLKNLTLLQYMEILRTIAKTVSYYHKAGYLCLDIKPENIFILQNDADDTVTQLVEFVDFDSIRKQDELGPETIISYTKDWAAPEQHTPFTASSVGPKTDIYTIGELAFFYLFGRHSLDREHRGFSKYHFEKAKPEYLKYTERPDISSLLTRLFRGTLRSSVSNRFDNISEVIRIFDEIIEELNRKEYIIPKFPVISPFFFGRNSELKTISENLRKNRILFVTGIGGIGKSTIIRNYIQNVRTKYDNIIYLEYDGNIRHTFIDDRQMQINTIIPGDEESPEEYFERKFRSFKNLNSNKKVLFILDNYSGMITKDLSMFFDCGYDTVIVTRNEPPMNSFSFINIEPISNENDLFNLITLNLGRDLTTEEKEIFKEIINLVQGHTLTLELIARQIAAGRIDLKKALDLIKENGFSRFSDKEIRNYKDGEEIYGTLSTIISALFISGNMPENARLTLKVLAFLKVTGLESDLVRDILSLDLDVINRLAKEGWLYGGSTIRLHPVIAETVRNWSWGDADDVTVMEYHKRIVDVYVGTSDPEQIKLILKEAEEYSDKHPRHIIKALYYDILGCYYDILCEGKYTTYVNGDADPIDKMIESIDTAISELEKSEDDRKFKFLSKFYLGLAGTLIRCVNDCKDEVQDLLKKTEALLKEHEPEYSENHCYYHMISAWYYTLIEPDMAKTLSYTDRAKEIAYKIFSTELEIIDVVYIPTANCLAEHDDLKAAADKLEEALEICRKYPEMQRYKEKAEEIEHILETIILPDKNVYFNK